MINDYIRGGQIFLHKFRMLGQVWRYTLIIAFAFSIIVSTYLLNNGIKKLDFPAVFTYAKALIISPIDIIFPNNTPVKISAITKHGTYKYNMEANRILKHHGFKRKYNEFISTLIDLIILSFCIIFVIAITIIIVWNRLGAFANSPNIIRGHKILSAKEVLQILKKLGKASDFEIRRYAACKR
ncbi:MAG UNVERIFIED_CONTAM: hypothetical protein LVQ98_09495 [Rickettsiaceae bacterium]|jgi:large-conductance mechanosensitive channel